MPAIKLNQDAWKAALISYPSRQFADSLVSAIQYGVHLGTKNVHIINRTKAIPSPLPSALKFPESVCNDIDLEVSLGRIVDVTDTPAAKSAHLSPLGSVPKKYSTKRRRIHHLSWPRGKSVNDAIPAEYGTLVYDAVLTAIDRIRSAGAGCFLYKADLEAAFRHIAIHPDDWWLMGFEWQGKTFLDIFLPFGLRTAPRIYNFFAEAHHWILVNRHASLHAIQHYLDDWLNVTSAAAGRLYAEQARSVFRSTTKELGFSLSAPKEEGPCHCLEFLGIELDTVAMEARLPQDKLLRLIGLLSQCLTRGAASHDDLEKLCGHLIFAQTVIPVG